MSIFEWTLVEPNEHGIVCNETPMGTFLKCSNPLWISIEKIQNPLEWKPLNSPWKWVGMYCGLITCFVIVKWKEMMNQTILMIIKLDKNLDMTFFFHKKFRIK